MAKINLLNTDTKSFLDLVGNGKVYRVPPYQRDYSWTDEQWEDLWGDLLELRANADSRHYMGALVVEGDDRNFLIIDGQQRLATLSILALAVIKRLDSLAQTNVERDQNLERAQSLRNRYIGEKDPASLIESSKLFLNETDNAFYQDYLVQLRAPLNPRGLPRSNKLLWDCFTWFSAQLGKVENLTTGAELATFLSEAVGRQLLFILITVDDEMNAYTVFETLNARGLELSSTDLLKNYLFSRIKVAGDIAALQRRWKALVSTVKQERFPEFLRYHLLCEYPKIRQQRLFKLIRDRIKTPEDVFTLITALEGRAELFAALWDVRHEYWIDYPACKPFIREFALFKVRQMTPLMFAAWERFSKDDFARLIKLIGVVSFRYTIVSGLNPNDLEPAYHAAAKAVLDGRASGVREVFDTLRSLGIYVGDDKFRQDFATLEVATSGQRKQLAKYILCKLENDASNRSIDHESDPGTIEHILPENPSADWDAFFPADEVERFIFRLGNLSLLEASANRQVGNALYAEKKVAYANSTYDLSKKVVDTAPEDWTPATLDARQNAMAQRATHVWRSDFT